MIKGNIQGTEVFEKALIGLDFSERAREDKRGRNERIIEAVYKYGCSQSDISEDLGIHYSTVSKILKNSRFKT